MSNDTPQFTEKTIPAPTPQVAASLNKTLASAAPQKRTLGLKIVDNLVYSVINNTAVFLISVVATYLTTKGNEVGKEGSTLRKVGEWFKGRGDHIIGAFRKTGMSKEQAEMANTVFFSFADGTVIAPAVKLLEDRRESMAKWIDTKLGTKPKDESVYIAEPKQTWGSVLKGRLLTSFIVVPVAYLLDKKTYNGEKLNNVLFRNPGKKTGEKIAANPKLSKFFGKLDLPELFRITYFEAFYTSVCTTGLYVISRFLAKGSKEHKNTLEEYKKNQASDGIVAEEKKSAELASKEDLSPQTKPSARISHPQHHQRVSTPHGVEITA